MKQSSLFAVAILLSLIANALPAYGQDLPTIEEKTEGLERRGGFFDVYWDDAGGKVWLSISRFDEEFLYVESLPHGLGSNDIGLDRGQIGSQLIVKFEKYGPKVLLVAPNYRYRAVGAPMAEARSIREAFAEGVVWSFDVVAMSGRTVLVDATSFVARDAHGVTKRLKDSGQGSFVVDESRSTPVPAALKSFPENTEMEARLTFTSDEPGEYVRDVAAVPGSFSLRIRHSFVRLPGPGFEPRQFHPRSGFFGPRYDDYSRPIGEDLTVRLIARHRLEKKYPDRKISDPVEPIVYYLDPGTPEPIRTALLDGARWWEEAFEAAGFSNAYRVEMLPEDADPLDVRYNVIQWVHRATRGWSYGEAVVDPRTGEIIKGHVSLGSLRVRQDYLIAEGLLVPYGSGAESGPTAGNDPMLRMALARIRQLSAHEVGHTIGLAHNFTASIANRASVMDYPAPLASVGAAGTIDISSAYATGIGEWDKLAVRYGYGVPEPGESESSYLERVLAEADRKGIDFLTDGDARPSGAAQPFANLWDNGEDMIRSLQSDLAVRRIAMANFSEAVVRLGRPLAMTEEVLVPVYLRHRYQIEATVKLLGGVKYGYVMRGDRAGQPVSVAGTVQRSALDALLSTLNPSELRIPEKVTKVIAPRPYGYPANRELFARSTGLTFDPYSPAEALAMHVVFLILDPERASRLVQQTDYDSSLPSFGEVLSAAHVRFFEASTADPVDAELQRVVQQVWVDGLVRLAGRHEVSPAVASRAEGAMRTLRSWIVANPGSDEETTGWRSFLLGQLDRYFDRSFDAKLNTGVREIPPGSPIGSVDDEAREQRRLNSLRVLQGAASEDACGWSTAF